MSNALVLRSSLLNCVRRPTLVNYWTGGTSKTIPCAVTRPRAKEGFAWVEIVLLRGWGKMRVQVPLSAILVRHRFMRPWVPLNLVDEVETLAGRLKGQSNEARIAHEKLRGGIIEVEAGEDVGT